MYRIWSWEEYFPIRTDEWDEHVRNLTRSFYSEKKECISINFRNKIFKKEENLVIFVYIYLEWFLSQKICKLLNDLVGEKIIFESEKMRN